MARKLETVEMSMFDKYFKKNHQLLTHLIKPSKNCKLRKCLQKKIASLSFHSYFFLFFCFQIESFLQFTAHNFEEKPSQKMQMSVFGTSQKILLLLLNCDFLTLY